MRVIVAGRATWPAEALAGDGRLAQRLLSEFDPAVVQRVLPALTDSSQVMGAVAWAAERSADSAVMNAIAPQVSRLLGRPPK